MSNQQHSSSEEEIEIGSLFSQIAKFYFYVLDNIKGFFRSILHGIVFLLVHFKKNFVLITSVTLIAGLLAIIIILSRERSYTSSMTVRPNYQSSQLLYKNIEYYNELLIQHDTVLLAKILNCSPSITSKLDEIVIEPLKTKNNHLEILMDDYSLLDSSLVASGKLTESIDEKVEDFRYEYHSISITARGNFNFTKMGNILLRGISKNEYFVKKQEKNRAEYLEQKKALLNSIKKMDTLSNLFNTVIVENSKKPVIASPNPLFEKERKSDLKDIKWAFDEYARFNDELSFVNVNLSFIKEPISIITPFNERGIKEPRLIKVLLSALAGFGVAIVFLLIKSLIFYLNRVEKDYL